MKLKNIALLGAMLASFTLATFADNSPINTCTQYLTNDDNAFYAEITSNTATAATIAQTLENCSTVNVCYVINDLNDCAIVLANRLFASEYYANLNPKSDHLTVEKTLLPVMNWTKPNNDNNEHAVDNSVPKTKKTDAAIHWF